MRKTQGFSRAGLALKAGLTRMIVSHYGTTRAISALIENLQRLARTLGLSVAHLVGDLKVTAPDASLADINPRNILKLGEVLSLPPADQLGVFQLVKKLLKKHSSRH